MDSRYFHYKILLFKNIYFQTERSAVTEEPTGHFDDLMSGNVIERVVPGQVWRAGVKLLGNICL